MYYFKVIKYQYTKSFYKLDFVYEYKLKRDI